VPGIASNRLGGVYSSGPLPELAEVKNPEFERRSERDKPHCPEEEIVWHAEAKSVARTSPNPFQLCAIRRS
jgi:hypothetical protein